jgi:hypothetical protein
LLVSVLALFLTLSVAAELAGCSSLTTCALCIAGSNNNNNNNAKQLDEAGRATNSNGAKANNDLGRASLGGRGGAGLALMTASCVWCLSSQSCAAMDNGSEVSVTCPLTSYTDCCFLKTGMMGLSLICILSNFLPCFSFLSFLSFFFFFFFFFFLNLESLFLIR